MKWQGIRRDSLDIGTAEAGLECINARFKVNGEMRRRRGFARTNIVKKGAAVVSLNGFSPFQSQTMAALTDGDRWQGYARPAALWGDNGAGFELYGNYPGFNGLTVLSINFGATVLRSTTPGIPTWTPGTIDLNYAGFDGFYHYWHYGDWRDGTRIQFASLRWAEGLEPQLMVANWADAYARELTWCFARWDLSPANSPVGTWSGLVTGGAYGTSSADASVTVSGTPVTSGITYAQPQSAEDSECDIGWFEAGTHPLDYVGGVLQFGLSPEAYCCTRSTDGSVKLQVYHDDAWHDFSATADQATSSAGAYALGAGKSYSMVLATAQQVKLRIIDASYDNNTSGPAVRFTVG